MTLNKEETKQALKEALKEWMDERAAQVGRWSFVGLLTMALAALAYFILHMSGWEMVKH